MSKQSTAALEAEIHRLNLEVHTLKAQQGSEISVGNYLLTRLEQLGVTVSSLLCSLLANYIVSL